MNKSNERTKIDRDKNKKILIITGNIGTGKSTVLKIFEKNGYIAISADDISAQILRNNHKTVSKIFRIRPMNFDSFKKELGKIVFSNEELRRELEDFMVPKINKEIDRISRDLEETNKKFIIEMPIFFETRGLQNFSDEYLIILVRALKNLRVERIKKRNPHLSEKEIFERINSQIDSSEKEMFVDFVLWNNSDEDELAFETSKLIKNLDL